ncbi:N-acetylmuramic acid 6-phosphate etherase [Cystobacter ferrugineus]|uniref:N-acetylmuramic acid 6-phosphate etherase n=1 Tax=Cystobacter ferrugineus TaxID=83449 RepID=A0A1L9BCP2_9BACT|nr:N-acetylmuramic acid 6-phosphate etherase [Cystobacter ferrugineus]OJH40024.1 N-acetylmuramic acid 6-phosphate etherase [Cystobacter ferrugineus]
MGKARSTSHALPPSEQVHPLAEDLDLVPPEEVIRRLHREDVAAVRAVRPALRDMARVARSVADALHAGGRLVYVGAGTSGRLGVLDASECPPTFGSSPTQLQAVMAGGPRAVTRAVEGAEDDAEAGARSMRRLRVSPRDVVCGVSASARTPFVRGALQEARRRGARTVLVCCGPPGPGMEADEVLLAQTGPELVAGSTRLKAGTATKLILNALSTTAFVLLGKVYRGRMVDMRPSNTKLRARAARMVAELTDLALPAAQRLLEQAGHEVKVALAMHFAGVSAEEARRRLKHSGLRELSARGPTKAPARKPRARRA